MDGGAGRSTGALTCFVTGVTALCAGSVKHIFLEECGFVFV